MKSVPNENILQLRKLTAQFCAEDKFDKYYKKIIDEMKKVLEESKNQIDNDTTPKEKVKCYEKMCFTITNLLQKIK
jgi:hypothetical protein